MFQQFFDSTLRVQTLRNGPSGVLLEGFAQALAAAAYAEITARRHIRAAEHFVYWAGKKEVPTSFSEEAVSHFVDHLSQCRCPGYVHANPFVARRPFVRRVCL